MLSVAELKKHLRIEFTTADDTYLADLEAAAVSVVEDYEGVSYAEGEVTHHLTGRGTRELWLPETPNGLQLDGEAQGVSITVHEAAYPGDDPTELDAADDDGFLVRGSRLVRKSGAVWASGWEYTVRYRRGGVAPERVYMAVAQLVGRWYTNRTGVSDARVGAAVDADELKKLLRKRAPRAG